MAFDWNGRKALVTGGCSFIGAHLADGLLARGASVRGMDSVFHLAADRGGRGYIDLHQANFATSFALDGLVFRAAHRAGVEQLTFASSGCVHPCSLQNDPRETIYLTEDLVKPPYESDNL